MTAPDHLKSTFRNLHQPGVPLILTNIWDAGSARAVAQSGASALATSSWAIAAAQGYHDGQNLPLEALLVTLEQIVRAVDLPVSADFEAGYADLPHDLAANIHRLAATGVVGFNLEDRVIGGEGLYPIAEHVARIKAAKAEGGDMFLNARTDVFFLENAPAPIIQMQDLLTRADAYRDAGADGLFVPGLTDPNMIRQLCAATSLPVNVMAGTGLDTNSALTDLGIARLSYGPFAYLDAMTQIEHAACINLESGSRCGT